MHIWRYPKPMFPTIPGTDTNVTPDRQEPIIAMATFHQAVDRVA